jgi:hypothetical protein
LDALDRLKKDLPLIGDHPDAPKTEDLLANLAYYVVYYQNMDKSAINNGIFAKHLKKTHSTSPRD